MPRRYGLDDIDEILRHILRTGEIDEQVDSILEIEHDRLKRIPLGEYRSTPTFRITAAVCLEREEGKCGRIEEDIDSRFDKESFPCCDGARFGDVDWAISRSPRQSGSCVGIYRFRTRIRAPGNRMRNAHQH
jgi:hypothetical protein